jgi:asparagine synthase (glutamine-hydrolysing)
MVERMCGLISHRGPNHEGIQVSGGATLGHRRLTITDLVTGQQPLPNEDRTVWVVFNGEVYNYKALRDRLESLGHRFETQTDTEVIPHLYEEY